MSRIPAQGGRINKNKRGSDHYVDNVTLCESEVGSSVRTERAVRTEMSKEEVTAANVCNASTLTLLRIRARNIRDVFESFWGSYIGGEKIPFLYNSKEGDGDDISRIVELRC